MSSSSQLDEENSKSELEKLWIELQLQEYKLMKDEENRQFQRQTEKIFDKKLEEQKTAFREEMKQKEIEYEELKKQMRKELEIMGSRNCELLGLVDEHQENLLRLQSDYFQHNQMLHEKYEENLARTQERFNTIQRKHEENLARTHEHYDTIERKHEENRARTLEHFDTIQRQHRSTVEKLLAEIDDLILENTKLKIKVSRSEIPENAKRDSKLNESTNNILDLQIINRYPTEKLEMLISKLESFFNEVIAYGRHCLQEMKHTLPYERKHEFGYVLLNFMRVEGNIKSIRIYLGKKIIGMENEYYSEKQELTSKMRKHDPAAIRWHKRDLQSCLRDAKSKMNVIKDELDRFHFDNMENELILLAYVLFSFQYNNQQLSLSGNSSFSLEGDFPEVYNFDIIEWIFQFFVEMEDEDFLDRNDYYKSTLNEHLSKLERLGLSDPPAIE